MAANWEKVNPDNAVDRLPQPFRSINKILEDILEAVGDQITVICNQRRSAEYEHDLTPVPPVSCINIGGQIVCTHAEPKGTSKLAIGTSHGEAMVIDTRRREIVAQRHAFGGEEPVTCVALCSDGSYAPRPRIEGVQTFGSQKPPAKLFVAGVTTPRINVYDVNKEHFGTVLRPACALHLPPVELPAPTPAKGEEEESAQQKTPLVQEMQVRGTSGGIWVLVLLADRSLHAYMCPLGKPFKAEAAGTQGGEDLTEKAIMEDEEDEEEGEGDDKVRDEFEDTVQVKTPTYSFALPSLAIMPQMPEPDLASIMFASCVLRPRDKATTVAARGSSAGQVPLLCFVSSSRSNVIAAYSLRAPSPEAAPEGLEVDALLTQTATLEGDPREPAEASGVAARRRWTLAGRTTAMVTSACGSTFAAGGDKGAIAVVDMACGLSMKTRLPGHYAAVRALCFHKADVLVSVGADAWVHHYDLSRDGGVLVARYLSASPPGPAPVLSVVAAPLFQVAITLDEAKELKILDLRNGRKIGHASCHKLDSKDEDAEDHDEDAPKVPKVPRPEERPYKLLATSEVFCALCEFDRDFVLSRAGASMEDSMMGGSLEEGSKMDAREGSKMAPHRSVAFSEAPGEDSEEPSDRSWLVFFDQATALKLAPPLKPVEVAPPPLEMSRVDATMKVATGRGSKTAMGDTTDRSGASTVVPLTAENLKKLRKPKPETTQTLALGGKSESSGKMGDKSQQDSKSENPLRVAPQNWQVSVRKLLRSGLGEKETRQRRVASRIEQLRKEFEEKP